MKPRIKFYSNGVAFDRKAFDEMLCWYGLAKIKREVYVNLDYVMLNYKSAK